MIRTSTIDVRILLIYHKARLVEQENRRLTCNVFASISQTCSLVRLFQSLVAKEQGLRSRAAFKLTQINRKFPLLEKCQTAILDLCAAPGGWTQIAARTCPKSVAIIAVDILPIRRLPGPNITTIIGDITTDKCKSDIQRAVQSHAGGSGNVDVVLHDGAPNVGADFAKDAYEQNELSLHALKCATQHLKKGGHFVTKLYRSRDYASYVWVLQQLFHTVSAFKPKASRTQSAEIFLVALQYKGGKVDARFLDPKHVFASVEGETTGGTMRLASATEAEGTGLSVFHKHWDKKQRKRGGYDMEHLDATMRHIETVSRFVTCQSLKEAIGVLSSSTGLTFACPECKEVPDKSLVSCHCNFLLTHPLTTLEIKECISDLQVLNKADFKGLIAWRAKMQDALKERDDQGEESDDDGEDDASAEDESIARKAKRSDADGSDVDSDKEEEEVQKEIEEMRQRRMRERKRRKKKERAVAAKRRRQAALGMDLNVIDIPEHDKVFSLASITTKGSLEAAAEVNLDQVTDEQIFGDSDDDIVIGNDEENEDSDDEVAKLKRRERDLDRAYKEYLEKSKTARVGTKLAKRSKKLMRLQVAEEAEEDQEMLRNAPAGIESDTLKYAEMLQGPRDSDEEESSSEQEDDDDDGYDAVPMTPEEHAQSQRSKRARTDAKNPLIHKLEEPASAKAARWFSNPLFANIGQAAVSAVAEADGIESDSDDSDASEDVGQESDSDEEATSNKNGLSAEEVLALIPKTEKQIRHERRLKRLAKEEVKRVKRMGEKISEADFEIAPGDNEASSSNDMDTSLNHLSESQKRKVLEARELIKAGMGSALGNDDDDHDAIEVVPQSQLERPLPVMDKRKYDSDHEDYDSDDYAQTLALGTMMLRRSKEKAFVDASYNRYAWNDPADLPEWFTDDERKHYRPQLPIPPALVAKMKEKMMALSARPIAKVAEARARKSKRAKAKLAAAKKQADAVANSSEMSEAMKLRAISKTLRGQETRKPGKTYVVAKKGRKVKAGKGVKVVDKRMKSDKRGMDKAEKRKGGKRKRR